MFKKGLVELLLVFATILSASSEVIAGRGLDAGPEQVNIYAIKSIQPKGLKLAQGWISYNDGDNLTGVFRIYCPTKMIRPTNYILRGRNGLVKQGHWWEVAFKPKWKVEHQLVSYVCSAPDFGSIQ